MTAVCQLRLAAAAAGGPAMLAPPRQSSRALILERRAFERDRKTPEMIDIDSINNFSLELLILAGFKTQQFTARCELGGGRSRAVAGGPEGKSPAQTPTITREKE